MNRKQQAKETDIIALLQDFGYSPSKKGTTKCWYNSPLADESVPSFVVNIQKNTWWDFGRGKGGDTLSFVMAYKSCTFSEAISIIVGGDRARPMHRAPDIPIKQSTIDIVDVKHIQNKYLIQYAESRGIEYNILSRHCKEVDFVFSNWDFVTHSAIGFENRSGGWELRSPNKKVGNSPKTWSMIRGTADVDSCDVFEGFFDFLSHLQYHGLEEPELDSYILNSLSFCEWVKPELEMYGGCNLYLDNNPPAKDKIEQYFMDDRYIDMSYIFGENGDYNEFLKSIIK